MVILSGVFTSDPTKRDMFIVRVERDIKKARHPYN